MTTIIPQEILIHPAFCDVDKEMACQLLDKDEVKTGTYILAVDRNDKYPKHVYIMLSCRGDLIVEFTINIHYYPAAKVRFGDTRADLYTVIKAMEKYFRKEKYLAEVDRLLPYSIQNSDNWNSQKNINEVLAEYTVTRLKTKLEKIDQVCQEFKMIREKIGNKIQELDQVINQKTIECQPT